MNPTNGIKPDPILEIITGPTWAGKSEDLETLVTKYKIAKKKPVVIKSERDKCVEGPFVKCHNGRLIPCLVIKDAELQNLFRMKEILEADAVICDETMYFDIVFKGAVEILFHHYKKNVHLYGLLSDSDGLPFETNPLHLCLTIPGARERKLTAICDRCGSFEAVWSKYMMGEKTSQIVINVGEEKVYAPYCLRCIHDYFPDTVKYSNWKYFFPDEEQQQNNREQDEQQEVVAVQSAS